MNKSGQNTYNLDELKTSESERRKCAIEALEKIAYVPGFSPFRVMRNSDHEIRHSNTLAWLFDKKENHGLEDKFAVAFFSKIFADVDWKEKFCGEVTIETEVLAEPHYFDNFKKADANKGKFEENKKLEKEGLKKKVSTADESEDIILEEKENKVSEKNKKIDILITGDDFTITIENKYGSLEHDWQCQRYRHYINNVYKNYRNYYVFLDIREPKNWYIGKTLDKKNLKYEDYELITYESVRDILINLTDDKKENKDAVAYIKKYIEILNETYDNFAPEIEKIFIDKLKYGEYIHELRDISSKLKYGRDIFERYSRKLQVNYNEPIVKRVLSNIVIKDFQKEDVVRNNKEKNANLIQYHFGSAGVTDPYAYKLAIGEYCTQKYNGFHELEKVSSYINEIDYKAKYGYYTIAFYFGTTTDRTKNWCHTAYNSFDTFEKKLEEMKKNGWDIWIEYNILNGFAQGSRATVKNLAFKLTPENLKKLKAYWSEEMTEKTVGRKTKSELIQKGSDDADENSFVLEMIKNLYSDENGKVSTEYNDVKKLIEDYFIEQREATKKKRDKQALIEDKEKEEKKLKDEAWAMTFRWTLALEYRINKKPIVTDKARQNIENRLPAEFCKRTKEGLNLFGLGDDFNKKIFYDRKRSNSVDKLHPI